MIEVRVPGTVYYECFDPGCTEFPREHPEVGTPTVVRIGKGRQFRYTVDEETAALMLDHAETFGEAISFGVDDPSAGRTVVRWVERERARIGPVRTRLERAILAALRPGACYGPLLSLAVGSPAGYEFTEALQRLQSERLIAREGRDAWRLAEAKP